MENRLTIETAQNVLIEHHIANVGERIVAYLIDGVVKVAYVLVIILFFSILEPSDEDIIVAIGILLAIPFLFYHLAMEIFFNGQSIGKMAMKIKVVKMNGAEVSNGSYFLRWLLRIVDFGLFYGAVALISILAGGKGQRVGDLAAGTTVVSTRPRQHLDENYFAEVPKDYVIVIPEVALLNDEDITTVKDVMHFVQKNQSEHAIGIAYKTKAALEEKMGISADMKARQFFETIIRDYTYYHTSIGDDWE